MIVPGLKTRGKAPLVAPLPVMLEYRGKRTGAAFLADDPAYDHRLGLKAAKNDVG